ncbi:hypothetical protein N7489_000244 [Penicillium chrysogenum]|uniref:uncharacterized protein n=1 Tax=Penicillium chrysogenum TaxID=5076 RepID=UPI0024DF2348|nr:uncharacterized protein N7489_000244 [Penicillium chrysogenum]KAJ5249834.1 hypothetical protein N7489_000244 [Penicillium chrysogenum]
MFKIKPDEPTGPAAGRSEKSASAQPSTNYPAASYRQGARATRSIERPNEPGSSSSLSADRASCLRSLRSEMVDTSSRRQDRFLNSTLPKPVHMQAPKGIDLPRGMLPGTSSDLWKQSLNSEKAHIRSNINAQREQDWTTSAKCGHLRKIDGTLPASYIRKLYGSLPRNRADLLTQLRTGHSWLSTYAKAFGFRDNDACQHMLVSPRLEVSLAGSFGLPYAE